MLKLSLCPQLSKPICLHLYCLISQCHGSLKKGLDLFFYNLNKMAKKPAR